MVPQRIVGVGARVARKFLAHDRARDDVESLQRHHRSQVRRIHLLPDSGPLAREQRRQHSVGEHDRAHLISDTAIHVRRRSAAAADRIHDSRSRLPKVIKRRLATIRPFGTVARRARINNPRVDRCEIHIAEPEPMRDALAKILHEDVAVRGESMDNLARLRRFQIQRDTFLVLVVRLEIIVAPALHRRAAGHRRDSAAGIAPLALLDLDHLGAQVGEHLLGDWPLLPYRPVDNSNSVKRSAHDFFYTTTLLSLGAAERINHICPRSPRGSRNTLRPCSTFCTRPNARRAERRFFPRPAAVFVRDASRRSSWSRIHAAKYAADRSSRRAVTRPDARDALRIRRATESHTLSRAIELQPRMSPAPCPR